MCVKPKLLPSNFFRAETFSPGMKWRLVSLRLQTTFWLLGNRNLEDSLNLPLKAPQCPFHLVFVPQGYRSSKLLLGAETGQRTGERRVSDLCSCLRILHRAPELPLFWVVTIIRMGRASEWLLSLWMRIRRRLKSVKQRKSSRFASETPEGKYLQNIHGQNSTRRTLREKRVQWWCLWKSFVLCAPFCGIRAMYDIKLSYLCTVSGC